MTAAIKEPLRFSCTVCDGRGVLHDEFGVCICSACVGRGRIALCRDCLELECDCEAEARGAA